MTGVRAKVLAVSIGALVASACSGGTPSTVPATSGPPPRFSVGPSGAVTVTPASGGSPGATVSPSPPSFLASPAKGFQGSQASATVKGGGFDENLDFVSAIQYPVYEPPTGVVNITWSDPTGNGLVIAANTLFVGTKKTSASLGLQLALTQPKQAVFASGDGSCSITFTTVQTHLLEGSFNCPSLKSANGVKVRASGSFRASVG